jgi:SAM-dependent methyltransferase
MLSNPLKGIDREVCNFMTSLIPKDDYYHQTHFRRLARTIEVILEQNPKGRLLELGTSSVVPLVLQEFAPDLEVVVTDFDLSRPREGNITLSMSGNSGEFSCYRLDLETEPLPATDGHFDYVLCSEVIEHMERDPMYMLSEINRTLRQNGLLFLTTPNVVSSRGITKMLFGIEPYFYMQYRKGEEKLYRHNYEYSVHSLAKFLKAAGFDGKAWTEDTFEDPIYRETDRLNQAGYNLQNLGDNIFTVSRKISPIVDRYPEWIYAD